MQKIQHAKEWLNSINAQNIYNVANEEYFKIALEDLPKNAVKMTEDFQANLVTMIANDERKTAGVYALYYLFSFPQAARFIGIKCEIPEGMCAFPSITPYVHAAHWYEREAQDLFGLIAEGHPDPRPLIRHDAKYDFFKVEGEGVFEVPVGPIHAGIIEPGHFRFSVLGEKILNLEARLFYTHRGLEKHCEGKHYEDALAVVERTCGVCSFSHAASYCSAIERISGTEIPPRAAYLRTIFLELERLYNHIGDLGNIPAGTGFHFGVSQMGVLKENLQNINEELTGSRFLRGVCIPGGLRFNITQQELKVLLEKLSEVEAEFKEVISIMLGHEFFISRMSETGVLNKNDAQNLGAVGPAARASGIYRDARIEQPHFAYPEIEFSVPVLNAGDVESRFRVRVEEVKQSFEIIRQCVQKIPNGDVRTNIADCKGGYAAGFTESPRGDNYHWVKLNERMEIERIRIRSASFCNWPAVAVSVPGNMIPDFPLINKSFELCYSCCDR